MEEKQTQSIPTAQPTETKQPTTAPTTTEAPKGVKQPAAPKDAPLVKPVPTQRTLSQEQVNKIIQRRLQASKQAMYGKHGIKDDTDFEQRLQRASEYEKLQEQLKTTEGKLQEFEYKKMLFSNKVNLAKYDDVVTYMKGKNLQMTPENVQQVLSTHPEWIRETKKPAVSRIGNTGSSAEPKVSDEDVLRTLFPSLRR